MNIRTIPYAEPLQRRETASGLRGIRRLIFGRPIASSQAHNTLLSKFLALPVFASDAISSVVYATQQILLALGAGGLAAAAYNGLYSQYTIALSFLIVMLLIVVVVSYWQTIFAYPNGGGSYIVSKQNLGAGAGLVAAAALLIDYVLTVSVSIASGVQNLRDVPMLASLHVKEHMVLYCVLFVAILTLASLRGLKESGRVFAAPTYIFVGMCYLMILLGLGGHFIGWQFHPEYVNQSLPDAVAKAGSTAGAFGLLVMLRAFANGCCAMTGTEAVSNGVPAFKEPRSRNAALTLVAMGVILGTIFIGISWLATSMHVVYWEHGGTTAPAVIDQLSGAVFGKTGTWAWAYVTTQLFTALILVLAANTSFADFPRLASILARDGYMPRQLCNLGDKLVFNNGIIVLGALSALLIAVKGGSVDALIPLYAIGVFLAFTLSQAGMVKHWFACKTEKGWRHKALINGLGALCTGVVLVEIAAEKFLDGAWVIVVAVIALVFVFRQISGHYQDVAEQLRITTSEPLTLQPSAGTVLVLVQGINTGTLQALRYARSLGGECIGLHVELDPERTPYVCERWQTLVPDVPLVILESPYRSLVTPLMQYLDQQRQSADPNHRFTVVIGEFVPNQWWQALLHGNTGLLLKLAFLGRADVVVANIRYHLEKRTARGAAAAIALLMIAAQALPVHADPPPLQQPSANTLSVPRQILRTGINLNDQQLSPNSRQLAASIGVAPLLDRLQRLRANMPAPGSEASLNARLDLLETIQEAMGIIEQTNFEVDFVLAEVGAEQNVSGEVLSTLTAKRDNIVNRSNQMSFITNGALWTVCEALAIPTWKRPKYGISSGIVGITAGMVPSIASMYAMYKSSGSRMTSEVEPNMLAKIFDYGVTSEVDYPKPVWAFLNAVPVGDASGKTRREQLVARWIADSNIPSFTSATHNKELDVLTGSVSHRKGLSIDALNTRHVMLNQLGAELFKMKRLLMELTMAVRGEKTASS